jgi:hypothetical protein
MGFHEEVETGVFQIPGSGNEMGLRFTVQTRFPCGGSLEAELTGDLISCRHRRL